MPLLRGWLGFVWTLARPLVRIPPTLITVLGVALAAAAVGLARPAPWPAAGVVLLAALCDALDGAVAVLGDSATGCGAVADAVADRLADVAFALVLWRCGAPLWVALVAAAVAVGVDVARRVVRRPTVITVAERPSWTICAVLACIASALSARHWPVDVCGAVWIVLGLIGLVQLIRVGVRGDRAR